MNFGIWRWLIPEWQDVLTVVIIGAVEVLFVGSLILLWSFK